VAFFGRERVPRTFGVEHRGRDQLTYDRRWRRYESRKLFEIQPPWLLERLLWLHLHPELG
jgi:hypothetical protein